MSIRAANGRAYREGPRSHEDRDEFWEGQVSIATGLRPSVRSHSLSGHRRNECLEGNDVNVSVQTVSGDIEIVPA